MRERQDESEQRVTAARALLRSRLRVRHHPGHRLPRRQLDLGWPAARHVPPRRAVVGLGGVCLAHQHPESGGRRRPDRRVRVDGRHADRLAGHAARIRRRRRRLRHRLLHRARPPSRPLCDCRPRRSGAAASRHQDPAERTHRRGLAGRRRVPRRHMCRWPSGRWRWRSTTCGSSSPACGAGASRRSTSSSATG